MDVAEEAAIEAEGVVSKILFETPGTQVFRLRSGRKSLRVKVSSDNRVSLGEQIKISGSLRQDERYGEQIEALQVAIVAVTSTMLRDFLTAGTGIGPAIADRILAAYPNNLIELIEQRDILALSSVAYVSEASARVIVNTWHAQAGKAALMRWVDQLIKNARGAAHRAVMQAARKAYHFYGEATVEKLTDDPYRLWAVSSWKSAETLAQAMGIDPADPRRLVCAVEEALARAFNAGHTQVYPLDFMGDLEGLVGPDLSIQAVIAANSVANMSPPRIVIRHGNPNPTQRQWVADLRADSPAPYLYDQAFSLAGPAIMEQYVADQLRLRLNESIPPICVDETSLTAYRLPEGHALSAEQQAAVRMVLNSTISIISGGAGTGKTSILFAVNTMIRQAGHSVIQVALAGKAAQRLVAQTKENAYTITRLLSEIKRKPAMLENLGTPVFHIDEASMVDLLTMYRLLKTFEGRPIRLVFIGDRHQLPPVGPGLIFHRLLESDHLPKMFLRMNYRSSSHIQIVADQIVEGCLPQANAAVDIIEYEGSFDALEFAQSRYIDELKTTASVHVIAHSRRAVSAMNVALHRELRKQDAKVTCAPEFRIGDQVIYKINSEALGIVNGSTGVVTGGDATQMFVKFDNEGEKRLETSDLRDSIKGSYFLQHGYAITCHAGQGSEFDAVFILLDSAQHIERSWLYTAITRAKQRVILCSKKGVLAEALAAGWAYEKIGCGLRV